MSIQMTASVNFIPDWYEIWTVDKAIEELGHSIYPFKWRGPGWYIGCDSSALLVVPTGQKFKAKNQLDVHQEGQPTYRFCYYRENPALAFNWIANAPVHQDDRK